MTSPRSTKPAAPKPRSGRPPRAEEKTWRAAAEGRLPDRGNIAERNAAITDTYAELYRDNRTLFKWAGMAAFASYRVGVALSLYALSGDRATNRALDLLGDVFGQGTAAEERLEEGLEILRTCNNDVYDDIAWTHLGYAAEGLSALDDIAEVPHYRLLWQGFSLIDAGRRLLPSYPRAAAEAIWDGNLLLLRHEQQETVQPLFARLGPGMAIFSSMMTWMDFDVSGPLPFASGWSSWKHGVSYLALLRDQWTSFVVSSFGDHRDLGLPYTSFLACMLTTGLPVLWRQRSRPNVGDFEQRWFWIRSEVAPLWRTLEEEDHSLGAKIARLARLR